MKRFQKEAVDIPGGVRFLVSAFGHIDTCTHACTHAHKHTNNLAQ